MFFAAAQFRARILNVLLSALALAFSAFATAQVGSGGPDVPKEYRKFFYSYSETRAVQDNILSAAGLDPSRVGKSFAVIAGISEYPKMEPRYQHLVQASEDVRKLADYLKNVEHFDEIIVLQNDDVTFTNLAFFLQGYFPPKLAADPNSRLLVAYSGHGFTKGHSSYLVTSPATRLDVQSPDMYNALNLFNLRSLIQDSREYGHRVLVLLNTCNSGDFLNRPFGSSVINPYGTSAYAITAGTVEQLSWAYDSVGTGSVFFEKFFAALDGRANNFYPDPQGRFPNLVNVDQLYNYLLTQVQSVTNKAQTPQEGDLDPNGSTGTFYFFDRSKLASQNLLSAWDENNVPQVNAVLSAPAAATALDASATAFGPVPITTAKLDAGGISIQGTTTADLNVPAGTSSKGDWSKAGGTTITPSPPDQEAWPYGAIAGGSYLVGPIEAKKAFPYVKLPDRFTLLFSPEVKTVQWNIQRLEIGQEVTIDLSAPQTVIPPGLPGADALGQPSWGVAGKPGGKGSDGTPGVSGTDLTMVINKLAPGGSAWIRTDGGPGGAGGRGGNGQLGGGSSCGNLREPHTNGGAGGRGGDGGAGGAGGRTSTVRVSIASNSNLTLSAGIDAAKPQPLCGRSTRTNARLTANNQFEVYGLPGCPGSGGPQGAPGPGGDEGRQRACSILGISLQGGVNGGAPGAPGSPGGPGKIGDLTAPLILQP